MNVQERIVQPVGQAGGLSDKAVVVANMTALS